jgi:hypothetical protein
MAIWVLLGISEAISFACFVLLWRREGRIVTKLFWSVVLVVPILGPAFFGALGRPLRPLPDEMQSHGRGYGDLYGPGGP